MHLSTGKSCPQIMANDNDTPTMGFENDKAKVELCEDAQLDDKEAGMVATVLIDDTNDNMTDTIDGKRLVRKIDWAILPLISLLFLLSFLDRSSIGNARLYGMEDDLNLSDRQYLICLSIFFVSYVLFAMPANICLRRLCPSIWFSSIMLLWGITMTVQGLVHNFGSLLATRWMIGVFEAGFSPGAVYYLSCWYKRDEIGFRLSMFNSTVALAGAFSGLLTAAISNMEGVGGKPAWAWIFILEGLITVLLALSSFWLLQDYPHNARFLTNYEREHIVRKLEEDDRPSADEKIRCRDIWMSIIDWKTWLAALHEIGTIGPLYAVALFLPSVIDELGFTATHANLLTVPVYAVSCIFACWAGFVADRTQLRGYFAMGLTLLTAIGYVILIFSRHAALSYFAVYLAACGTLASSPNSINNGESHHRAWVANNFEGSNKRSVSIAIGIACGNLTGIITTNMYRSKDTPWYVLGHGVVLLYVVLGHLAAVAFHVMLRMENKRRDRGERDEVIAGKDGGFAKNGCFESVDAAKREKGDCWSGYRYIT